jgi:hypothetical protein
MGSSIFKTAVLVLMFASPAYSKTMRYSDMSETDFGTFLSGESGDVAEFRSGDILRLKVKVSGDILESINDPATEIFVKKSFFLKVEDQDLMLSWDNIEFLAMKDQIRGQLKVSATGNEVVSTVAIELEANQQ